MSKLTRINAILPFTPGEDLTGKEGSPVSYVIKNKSIALYDDQSSEPFGVVVHGTDTTEKSSVALFAGGLAGTVKVKLGGTVSTVGADLWVADDGTFHPSPVVSAAFVCAKALEEGVAGELVEAVLFRPQEVTA